MATHGCSPRQSLPILSPFCASFLARCPVLAIETGSIPRVAAEQGDFGVTSCVVDRAIGETMQAEYGPATGSQRVGECLAEKGLMCISESGARQYNRRRRSCRDMSLYRPDEVQYMRPDWRLDLDRWLGSFGDFGEWKANLTGWRWQHAEEMRALNEWAASHGRAP